MGRRLLVSLVLSCLAPFAAQACPACNIHNYFWETISTSDNVFVGELTAVDEGKEADAAGTVRVLRVLRGSHKPGDMVKVTDARWGVVGQTYIVSDPTFTTPGFPFLEWDALLEQECALLARLPKSDWMPNNISGSPTGKEIAQLERHLLRNGRVIKDNMGEFVKDADEAVALTQSISNLGKLCAFSYILHHPAEMRGRIEPAIAKTKERAEQPEARWEERYRLGSLAEALTLTSDPEAEAFALREVAGFLKSPSEPVDFAKERTCYTPSLRAYYTLRLVRSARSSLSNRMKRQLSSAYPQLHGLALAEATNVLCELGTSPAQLRARLKSDADLDHFALGVMWIASDRVGGWQKWEALRFYDAAAPAARNEKLKTILAEGFHRAEAVPGGNNPPLVSSGGSRLRRAFDIAATVLLSLLFFGTPSLLVGRYFPLWARMIPLLALLAFAWGILWDGHAVLLAFLYPTFYAFFVFLGLLQRARKTHQRFGALHPYDMVLAALSLIASLGWYWHLAQV